MRALLDTNVIVSAIVYGGIPRDCLRRALAGEFDLVTGTSLLDELERILRDRFGFSAEAVNFVRRDLELAADLVAPGPIDAVSRDPTDDVVLAVAQAGQVNYIVTGDRDLLSLEQHGGAVIVDPRAFIDTLAGRVE